MRPESEKLLYDIGRSADRIAAFTLGKSFEQYRQDDLLRSGVERRFEIIGEALRQPSGVEPGIADRITDRRRIVGFRNILVHAYSTVDDRIVWGLIGKSLVDLRQEVGRLLKE